MTQFQWNPDAVKAKVVQACNAGLWAVGATVQTEISKLLGVRHGGIPSKPGQPPNSQTGNLRNSIVVNQPQSMTVHIGPWAKYARTLEFGARIGAKGKALCIPLSPEVKRQVAAGVRPKSIINAYSFDKQRPLRWVPTRKGGTLIVRDYIGRGKGQKGARTEALFLLVRSVTIQPRPFIRPGFERAKPKLLGEFTKAANASFRRLAGAA